MGVMDRLRSIFSRSNDAQPVRVEDNNAKLNLVTDILNLADKIQRINCFDGSIRGLTNLSSYELQRKSMEELEKLHSNLSNKYASLVQQRQRYNAKNDAAIAAKWTGQRTQNMTDHDLDFYQGRD